MMTRTRRRPPNDRTTYRVARDRQRRAIGSRPATARPRRVAVLLLVTILSITLLVEFSPSAAVAKPKPLAKGLMSQGMQLKLFPGIVNVLVPNIAWSDIEPQRGVFRFGAIQNAIRTARAHGDVLRLRIYAGRMAPAWTMRRFGSVMMYDPIDGRSGEVPRWWVRGYRRAYAHLQAKLAKAFDGNPTIRAVTISEPMTIYAEPFIRGLQDSRTRHDLVASTYTKRKDQHAFEGAIRAHRVWRRTRQILTVNPWQYINQDGSFGFHVRFTNKMMNLCRRIFRTRCILQNNSMRASWLTDHMPGGYRPMFRHMRKLGRPISFQTSNTSRVGDLTKVLNWFLKFHAHGVELKAGAVNGLTITQAKTFDAEFAANG
jgi:glycosyl hydrolase family 42 (putative beta-galactosidase)